MDFQEIIDGQYKFWDQPVVTNVTYYFSFGVCCLFIVSSTSDTINQNCTYIQNPSFPSVYSSQTALTYTINKCSSDVCSVRLDFETMTIQGNFRTLGCLILPNHWVLVTTKIMLLKPVQNSLYIFTPIESNTFPPKNSNSCWNR